MKLPIDFNVDIFSAGHNFHKLAQVVLSKLSCNRTLSKLCNGNQFGGGKTNVKVTNRLSKTRQSEY